MRRESGNKGGRECGQQKEENLWIGGSRELAGKHRKHLNLSNGVEHVEDQIPSLPEAWALEGLALCLESPPRTLEGVAAMGVGQEVARASAVQTRGSCPSVQMGIDSLCFLSSICVVCFPLTVSDD
uniref:Uncharacterized protein n=1 Tax=Rousettus aegyptiacus TaxID=9407 RepID=A0A7J8H296_ROUAE|nr:hypothetical protein HJG63_011256 [Rousettus aegyptiacus]